MPNITAYVTDDARTLWPQFFGYSSAAVPFSTGLIQSPTVFTNPFVPLSTLAVGDLFYLGGIHRKLSIPTAAACLTGGNVWIEEVSTGIVTQISGALSVNRLRNWSLVPTVTSFKVGEGGWIDLGTGRQPRPPSPSLRMLVAPPNDVQDIDATVDTTRAVIDQRYPSDVVAFSWGTFEKQIPATDILFEAPFTQRFRCFIDFGEFNDDGFGHNPEIWEIGLFSDHPTVLGQKLMVAYGTFPMQTKNNATSIENFVRIGF